MDDVKPAPKFLKTGKAMNATSTITRRLAVVSARVNAVLRYGDPAHYVEARRLRETMQKLIPSYNNLSAEDILVYEGREILYNRCSGLHTDSRDPQKGYAILTAFGNFKGGYVRIPHLGLRIRLEPGDAIALRGWVMPHQIEQWDEGQRISIPHFTHSSVWKCFGFKSVFTYLE